MNFQKLLWISSRKLVSAPLCANRESQAFKKTPLTSKYGGTEWNEKKGDNDFYSTCGSETED